MKNCSYCGHENPDDAKFCLECGKELVVPEATEEGTVTKLVTVSSTFDPSDAQLIRSRLEAAGFHPELTNEIVAESFGGVAIGSKGIRVQVPEDEATDAREFLEAPAE